MNQETPKLQKVLYVITKATSGGAQHYVRDLIRKLPRDSYQPILAYGETGTLVEELKAMNVETVEIPSLRRDVFLLDDLNALSELRWTIRHYKPDIVHLNSSKAAALGALAARLSGVKKIIFTVHGWPFKEPRDFIERGFIYAASWLTAFLSHKVIVVSSDDEKIGKSMWRMKEKVHYIPVGAEPLEYVPQEEALQALWKLVPADKAPREAVRVVTIAELTRNKGHRHAIEAMFDLRTHSTEHYVYFMIGSGELLGELEKLVQSHHIEDKVFFLGPIPDAARYLRAFDIFLLPSLKEGMPYVLLEANDSGIPTVATDVVSKDMRDKYPNMRVVHAGNSFVLADAIRTIGKHDWAFTTKLPEQKFPLTTMIESTLEVYKK